jgi:hypothetical protein
MCGTCLILGCRISHPKFRDLSRSSAYKSQRSRQNLVRIAGELADKTTFRYQYVFVPVALITTAIGSIAVIALTY